MAIINTFNFKGLEVNGAYIKIARCNYVSMPQKQTTRDEAGEEIVVSVTLSKCEYTAFVYATSTARDAAEKHIDSLSFVFDLDSTNSNIVDQAYSHLKSQPGFEAAQNA